MNETLDVKQSIEIYLNYMMDPESEIVNISKDMKQNKYVRRLPTGGAVFGRPERIREVAY